MNSLLFIINCRCRKYFTPKRTLQCGQASAEATTLTSGNVAVTTELLESGRKARLTVAESK